MRRIHSKNGSPQSFNIWKEENKERIDELLYDEKSKGDDIWKFFKNDNKKIHGNKTVFQLLRETLVKDQGFICCYCGQRIQDDHNTPIEHLLPKGESKYKKNTLDFDNLLASCTGGSKSIIHVFEEGQSVAIEDIAEKYGVDVEYLKEVNSNLDSKSNDLENLSIFGKILIIPSVKGIRHCDSKKGNKEIDIYPLQDDCAAKFNYVHLTGEIRLNKENTSTVINILGLNDSQYIKQRRRKTLDEAVFIMELFIEEPPANLKVTVNKFIENLNTITESNKKLEPFVFVKIWSLQN